MEPLLCGRLWLERCNRKDLLNYTNYRKHRLKYFLCHYHFEEDSFLPVKLKNKRKLRENSLPSTNVVVNKNIYKAPIDDAIKPQSNRTSKYKSRCVYVRMVQTSTQKSITPLQDTEVITSSNQCPDFVSRETLNIGQRKPRIRIDWDKVKGISKNSNLGEPEIKQHFQLDYFPSLAVRTAVNKENSSKGVEDNAIEVEDDSVSSMSTVLNANPELSDVDNQSIKVRMPASNLHLSPNIHNNVTRNNESLAKKQRLDFSSRRSRENESLYDSADDVSLSSPAGSSCTELSELDNDLQNVSNLNIFPIDGDASESYTSNIDLSETFRSSLQRNLKKTFSKSEIVTSTFPPIIEETDGIVSKNSENLASADLTFDDIYDADINLSSTLWSVFRDPERKYLLIAKKSLDDHVQMKKVLLYRPQKKLPCINVGREVVMVSEQQKFKCIEDIEALVERVDRIEPLPHGCKQTVVRQILPWKQY